MSNTHEGLRRPREGHGPGPLYRPTDPLRDAIRLISGREPPEYVRGWDLSEISDVDVEHLQDWLSGPMDQTETPWGTGIGALEAAEHIVSCAIDNGNIWHPSDYRWKS